MPQKSFLMPQKLFLNSNLKLRREKLTLREFYHLNAGKNDSGPRKDDSMARPMGLVMTIPVTRHPLE
jgi:hypothetical protein